MGGFIREGSKLSEKIHFFLTAEKMREKACLRADRAEVHRKGGRRGAGCPSAVQAGTLGKRGNK